MSPAWKSKTKATATRSKKGWKVALEIPWNSLRPTVGKGSVWGVDVSHLRRGNTGPAEVSRTVKTSLVHYDLDRNSGGFRIAHEKAVEKADGMPPLSLDLAMVGSIDLDPDLREQFRGSGHGGILVVTGTQVIRNAFQKFRWR